MAKCTTSEKRCGRNPVCKSKKIRYEWECGCVCESIVGEPCENFFCIGREAKETNNCGKPEYPDSH